MAECRPGHGWLNAGLVIKEILRLSAINAEQSVRLDQALRQSAALHPVIARSTFESVEQTILTSPALGSNSGSEVDLGQEIPGPRDLRPQGAPLAGGARGSREVSLGAPDELVGAQQGHIMGPRKAATKDLSSLLEWTRGCVLCSVPHHGSNLMQYTTFGPLYTSTEVKELVPGLRAVCVINF